MGHQNMIEEFNPLREDILQVIDKNGGLVQPKYEPSLSSDELKKIYCLMMKTRAADRKIQG